MSASDNRKAGGYKATMNRSDRSEETKERAKEKLEELEGGIDDSREEHSHGQVDFGGKNEGNVLGGYKATLKNPRVSEEAKQNAKEILEEHDAL